MDPETLAMIQALLGPQPSVRPPLALPPTYSGQPLPAGPGAMPAAAPPQADPRAQWEAILYGAPPAPPEDPRWATMGKAGRVGLILSALGDVANVLQRRSAKGARTFRPSNYTGEFMEGQRGQARQRYEDALRADAVKRTEAGHRIGQIDRQEAERRRAEEIEAQRGVVAGRQEDDDLRTLRHKAAAAGVMGAASMSEAQLLDAVAEKVSAPKPVPAPRGGGTPPSSREAERAATANQKAIDKKMAPTKKLLAKRDKIGADIDATVEQLQQGIHPRTVEETWDDLRIHMKQSGIAEGSPEWNHLAEKYWAGVSNLKREP